MFEAVYDAAYRSRWDNLRLTPHFRLGEFAASRDYPELAAQISFRSVEVERIRWVCIVYLEPLRAWLKSKYLHRKIAVIISSGKRSVALNDTAGGVKNSHHLYLGNTGAVDIYVPGVDIDEIVFFFTEVNRIPFDYIVRYPERGFIHLSYPSSEKAGIGDIRTKH